MGADRCVGAQGSQGDTKTRQTEPKNGRAGYFCDTMAGEISPNMMFCGFSQKCSKMRADG